MDVMLTLFRLSGAAAIFFLVTAAASGFWGSKLRRVMSPQSVMKLHRGLGLAGVGSGLVHGLVYWLLLQ